MHPLTSNIRMGLRMEEETCKRLKAMVNAARQSTKDGNLSPAQQRKLQNEFPHFRMGRTDMHLVPSALDRVQRNQVILQAQDNVLRGDEAFFIDRLNALFKSDIQKKLAVLRVVVDFSQSAMD